MYYDDIRYLYKTSITILTLFFISLCVIPQYAYAGIEIVEIRCNPEGSDAEKEWIKIKNTGESDIDITGWKFNDGSNHVLNAPPKNGGVGDLYLRAGESALLANKAEFVSGAETIIDTVMALSNSGDTLSLIDVDGVIRHQVTYTADDVVVEGNCFPGLHTNSDTATTTSSAHENVITTIHEVTQFNTVSIEPPSDIFLRVVVPEQTFVGSVLDLFAEVYDARGRVVFSPTVVWSFGDGITKKGTSVQHTYRHAGNYVLVIRAESNQLVDEKKYTVHVSIPVVSLSLSPQLDFIEITNEGDVPIDISQWSVKARYKRFVFPQNTYIAEQSSVRITMDTLGLLNAVQRERAVTLHDAEERIVADTQQYQERVRDVTATTTSTLEETHAHTAQVTERETSTIRNETSIASVQQQEVYVIKSTAQGQLYVAEETRRTPPVRTQPVTQAVQYTPQEFDSASKIHIQSISQNNDVGEPEETIQSMQHARTLASASTFVGSMTGWIMALLALLALAIVSVMGHGVARTRETDTPIEDTVVDDFTIEELK